MKKFKFYLGMFFQILKAEKFFFPPKYKPVLLYDAYVFSNKTDKFLETYIQLDDVNKLDLRFNEINIFILIKTLLKNGIKKFLINYTYEYIKSCNPKIIVNFTDADLRFYLQKKNFKKKIFISIQNGYRNILAVDLFSKLMTENHKDLGCDYILCFGQAIAKYYEKYIDCKALPVGSFKNNFFLKNNKKKINSEKIKKISFISQFRYDPIKGTKLEIDKNNKIKEYVTINPGKVGNIEGVPRKIFYRPEKIFLPKIQNKCREMGLKLNIIGCSIRGEEEYAFFKDILGNDEFTHDKLTKTKIKNFEHLISLTRSIKDGGGESYMKMLDSDILFFVDSTLGYEALGIGKKAASFSTRPSVFKDAGVLGKKGGFGWPNKFIDEKGLFWTNIYTNEEAERIINNIFEVSDDEWSKELLNINPQVMTYDNDNSVFKEILSKELKKNIYE